MATCTFSTTTWTLISTRRRKENGEVFCMCSPLSAGLALNLLAHGHQPPGLGMSMDIFVLLTPSPIPSPHPPPKPRHRLIRPIFDLFDHPSVSRTFPTHPEYDRSPSCLVNAATNIKWFSQSRLQVIISLTAEQHSQRERERERAFCWWYQVDTLSFNHISQPLRN